MSKILIAVLAAVGVLSACSTDTGPTYTAYKVNMAGQRDTYRVNCSGLFESEKSCMAAAARICKDQQVVLTQALDGVQGTQGRNNPREMTFTCGTPPAPVVQAPAPQPAPAPAPAPVAARRVVLQGDTNFDTGSATLTSTAQSQLNAFLTANNGVRFTKTQISGYTDSTGSVESNQRLSQARAESVARYLGARGLQSEQIEAKGFGASNPVASNATAAGRAQNRRVEINVTATQ
ncbi:OmpA/MotB domain-containing protein [Caballeronia arvi]|uniref:OmpA/MotB domain-containing protein n=1 Tax=Caballeronia arvi TaxID=1777135 RepID=A0A158JGZ7_9BURK|nr:OmpA family protein [Caballeronia arvi]SAL67915.1 OmpA/MotB domain-containing protein [Caballeronia arvi]